MTNLDGGVYVVFDGPPGAVAGRFVEVEDEHGRGLGPDDTRAHWCLRADGYWALGPFDCRGSGQDAKEGD